MFMDSLGCYQCTNSGFLCTTQKGMKEKGIQYQGSKTTDKELSLYMHCLLQEYKTRDVEKKSSFGHQSYQGMGSTVLECG